MIAYLGTGLLGANFVRAFRRRNEEVQVWNRTFAKAKALEEVGAKAFERPADAVRGATRVHITLVDDASVDAALDQAAAGLAPGTTIIDHTTTSPDATAARITDWTRKGFVFQHAPVFMGPQNALEGTGTMLASGNRAVYDRISPVLEKMTGKVIYLGEDPRRAASIKLLGNLFLIATGGALADMFVLAKALGVPGEEVAQIFDWFSPAPAPRAARMRDGDLTHPSFTLSMARKDTRLMIESAAAEGAKLAVMPAVAAAMDRWIAAGHGGDDWMIIGKDAVSK